MRNRFCTLLAHGCAVLALAALVITVADSVNSQMGFLYSTPGRAILIAANAFALALGVLGILKE